VVKISPRLENLVLNIVHEDAGLLVINKPAGLVCHPTKSGEMSSLIGRARLYLNFPLSAAGGGEGRGEVVSVSPHLVNRLDRETSGIVIIAKNSEIAGELGKLWESRAVRKEYLAIVHGLVRDDHGLIDAPLGKDEQSRVAVKDCVRPDGAPAQTEFRVERRFSRYIVPCDGGKRQDESGQCVSGKFSLSARLAGGEGRGEVGLPSALDSRLSTSFLSTLNPVKGRGPHGALRPQPSTFSLLRVIPRTGRKHQIRIHLAHLGHPIVGDKLYGGDEDLYLALVENRLTPEQLARLMLPHQALHARAVRFTWRGQPMEFSCAPEPWFTDFLNHG
jgi:23S rRNA-/tRNA-specific pseudouridylate synthase